MDRRFNRPTARKSTPLLYEYPSVPNLRSRPPLRILQGEVRCFGGNRKWLGRPGGVFSPAKKRWIVGNRQRETLPLPKRGSLVHALIDFVLRLRLSKRIACKGLFIEKERLGVRFPLRRGPLVPG